MPLDFVGGLIDTASNIFTSERNKEMSQDVLDEQKKSLTQLINYALFK